MASNPELIQYLCEQLTGAGTITSRKMFGEYGLYCDGKIFALICGDQFYVKITEAGRKLCPNLEEAPPYEGAKNYLLVDNTEDRELLTRLVTATCRQLPEPKPKKPRKKPSSGKP